jgi:hypothetical protein
LSSDLSMEPKKDKWINDILASADGIERAEPGPFLYTRIRNRLATSVEYVPARTVWLTIASFALLLLLNWRVTSRLSEKVSDDNDELNAVITDMQLDPTSNQPYNLWSGQNY